MGFCLRRFLKLGNVEKLCGKIEKVLIISNQIRSTKCYRFRCVTPFPHEEMRHLILEYLLRYSPEYCARLLPYNINPLNYEKRE